MRCLLYVGETGARANCLGGRASLRSSLSGA